MTPRKALRAAGAMALVRVEEALRAELVGLEARLDDLREKMTQLLAVHATHTAITLSKTSPRAAWLNTLWSSMGKLPEATGMHRYLEVSLSHADRMCLVTEHGERWMVI